MKDVHTEHCCLVHGCKYGEDDACTVVQKVAPQSFPCESCNEEAGAPDLKRVLMEMGNKLVLEHGFDPSPRYATAKSTTIIQCFTQFVNERPEAREVLRELGFKWSM